MKRKNRASFMCAKMGSGTVEEMRKVRMPVIYSSNILEDYKANLCWCSWEAFDDGWDRCDLVCDRFAGTNKKFDDCECSNNGAGPRCKKRACWHKGDKRILCTDRHRGRNFNLDCSHLNKTRPGDSYSQCDCYNGGTMKSDGNCQCQKDYRGLLCNHYKPPPTVRPPITRPPVTRPRPPPHRFSRPTPRTSLPPTTAPYQKPTTRDTTLNPWAFSLIAFSILAVVTVILVLVIYFCHFRKRQRPRRLVSFGTSTPIQQQYPMFGPPMANESLTPTPMAIQQNQPIFGEPIFKDPWNNIQAYVYIAKSNCKDKFHCPEVRVRVFFSNLENQFKLRKNNKLQELCDRINEEKYKNSPFRIVWDLIPADLPANRVLFLFENAEDFDVIVDWSKEKQKKIGSIFPCEIGYLMERINEEMDILEKKSQRV